MEPVRSTSRAKPSKSALRQRRAAQTRADHDAQYQRIIDFAAELKAEIAWMNS